MNTFSSEFKRFFWLVAAVAAAVAGYSEFVPSGADIVVLNGVIYTMDDENSIAEAMAIRGGRIVGVGSTSRIARKFSGTTVVDAKGKTILPGLIDAHAHFISLGIARMTVDLLETQSETEAADRVKARAAKSAKGQWIRGRGWDQNDWKVRNFPSHQSLDRVAPENPVVLSRVDGHAIWVNRKGMELAGVTRATKDPDGGKIVRDAQGDPTGVFVDNAEELITNFVPPPSDEELEEAITLAQHECLSLGLTSVHDMGVTTRYVDAYKKLIDEGMLKMRLYGAIGGTGETWDAFKKSGPLMGYGDQHLTVRALKMYIDGALGSRGAALIEEYADDPGNRGLTVTAEADLQRTVNEALAAGFQVCTHAIGDRGNNIVLNVYEKGLAQHPSRDPRLRVEHAQVLLQSDIPRFSRLGVVPSMQPTHCTSDMYWAEARLGPKRILGAYAWRSLLKTGARILGGSDFPVEHPNPLMGIYAAATRKDKEGKPNVASDIQLFQRSKESVADSSAFVGGWYAEQAMTREEAVRAFTSWAAWGAFEESIKGSLEKGKLGDFIILSKNIVTVPEREILSTQVEETYVGGERVFVRAARAPDL